MQAVGIKVLRISGRINGLIEFKTAKDGSRLTGIHGPSGSGKSAAVGSLKSALFLMRGDGLSGSTAPVTAEICIPLEGEDAEGIAFYTYAAAEEEGKVTLRSESLHIEGTFKGRKMSRQAVIDTGGGEPFLPASKVKFFAGTPERAAELSVIKKEKYDAGGSFIFSEEVLGAAEEKRSLFYEILRVLKAFAERNVKLPESAKDIPAVPLPEDVIIIDDIDGHLFEPEYGKLLRRLNASGCQVIFTAHSLRALDELDKKAIVFSGEDLNPYGTGAWYRLQGAAKTNSLRNLYEKHLKENGFVSEARRIRSHT